ncbi:MAG: hypothetical protein IAE83_13300 [Anaerolinea sp.]|nr:hypothetical protein [Anaerolinea sp.]MCC6974853.1 hypothetical protein [Anaerolineae bacterium]
MTADLIVDFLRQVNEVLTAATVIVAFSMLLYNLTHGMNDRVARASSWLLGCVTIIYLGDVFVALSKQPRSIENWLRFEWIGLAIAPAALFHLSDTLLSTTGLRSRGRRRRVVRLLYMIGACFLVAGVFTELLVHSLVLQPAALMKPGGMFGLYVIFFVSASGFALNNVRRTRERCLTRATRRRMSYLMFTLLLPVAGIFPYSLLFTQPAESSPLGLWFLINLGNLAIVLMLALMAYPLSFFGPKKPDRVIKSELLSFMLRGPVTGVAVLVVVMFVPRLSGIGIPGAELVPFAAVSIVLALQWSYTAIIPFLERKLIYTGDQESVQRVQELSEHLLTPADAAGLLESNLAALCEFLRVPSAFVVSLTQDGSRIEQVVGGITPAGEQINTPEFQALVRNGNNGIGQPGAPIKLTAWQSFWIAPLYQPTGSSTRVIGTLGIWARSAVPDLLPEEEKIFRVLSGRIARVLNDMRVQDEFYARLEDVLEDAEVVPAGADLRLDYSGEVAQLAAQTQTQTTFVDQPEFVELIREALRDYWGGPRLTDERLLSLAVMVKLMPENENNPAKAARALLNRAIERLKPEGPRSLTLPEWTLYNVIDLRFVQGKKVRDVARQISRGEADIYRKQTIAFKQIAHEIGKMEHQALLERGEQPTATAPTPKAP